MDATSSRWHNLLGTMAEGTRYSIFLSYRRSDAGGYVGWLHRLLVERFPDDEVFRDVDSLLGGERWVDHLVATLARCNVILAVIGPDWLTASNETGRRLDDPQDRVRLELEAGIRRGVALIPTLVGGTKMPAQEELPPSLASLHEWQAVRFSDESWQPDFERLCDAIERAREAGPGELQLGVTFAGHRIEALVGRGGMGVVYRARHLGLNRGDAIKVIAPDLARSKQFRDRFVRESHLAASVSHENVVTVYDAGEEGGLLYLAMQLVEGRDLATLLAREAPVSGEQAVEIMTPVAAALDAAHDVGLVHRDVKPGNILIEERQGKRRVFLGDFGLAREKTAATGLTSTGHWIGTADYVSPEQVMGEEVDGRADVYALGCVLFEMLSGRVPYPARSETAKLVAHATKRPPALAELRPDLAGPLDEVVRTAMARDPEQRYASAGGFSNALRAAVSRSEQVELPTEQETATVRMTDPRERQQTEREGAERQAAHPKGERNADTREAAEREQADVEATTQHGAESERVEREAERERADREAAARQAAEREQAKREAEQREREQRPPTGEGEPRLKGPPRVGSALKIAGASFSGGRPIALGYQWERRTADGAVADVADASGATFVPSTGDVGSALRARITATSAHGTAAASTPWSDAVAPARSTKQRLPLLLGVPGAVIAALIVAVIALSATGGAGTSTGAGTSITVGLGPDAIAVGQGSVWVANSGDAGNGNTVTRIDTGTGKVIGSPITVGSYPIAIAVGQGSVWVANYGNLNGGGGGGNTVTRIDAGTGKVIGSPITVGSYPDAIAVGQGSVWVAIAGSGSGNSGGNTVTRIDASTGKVIGTPIKVGNGPAGIAVGQGSVWVANGGGGAGNTVTRIDASTGKVMGTPIKVGNGPAGIAVGQGSVWVANGGGGGGNTVTRIDASTGKVIGSPITVGSYPDAIAVGQGSVWVANLGTDASVGDTVTRIDAATGKVIGSPITVGTYPDAIAVGQGSVWVAIAGSGLGNSGGNTVTRIDASTGKVIGGN